MDIVSSRLAEKELTEDEYESLIKNQLVENDLVGKRKLPHYLDAGKINYVEEMVDMSWILSKKLRIEMEFGLKNMYRIMENTPLSEAAQRDIQDYNDLYKSVKNRVNDLFGEGPLFEDQEEDFDKIVEEYVISQTRKVKGLGKYRMSGIAGGILSELKWSDYSFTERPGSKKMGNYTLEDVERTLEGL